MCLMEAQIESRLVLMSSLIKPSSVFSSCLHVSSWLTRQYFQRMCGRRSRRLTSLPLLQERLVAPCYLSDFKQDVMQSSFDYEAAAKALAGKLPSGCHTSPVTAASRAPPVVSPLAQRTDVSLNHMWQDSAIDLTKSSGEPSLSGGDGAEEAPVASSRVDLHAASSHMPPNTAPLTDCVAVDIGRILQSGLMQPMAGQLVNGSLKGDHSIRTKGGKRRSVDSLYCDFSKTRGLQLSETQVSYPNPYSKPDPSYLPSPYP